MFLHVLLLVNLASTQMIRKQCYMRSDALVHPCKQFFAAPRVRGVATSGRTIHLFDNNSLIAPDGTLAARVGRAVWIVHQESTTVLPLPSLPHALAQQPLTCVITVLATENLLKATLASHALVDYIRFVIDTASMITTDTLGIKLHMATYPQPLRIDGVSSAEAALTTFSNHPNRSHLTLLFDTDRYGSIAGEAYVASLCTIFARAIVTFRSPSDSVIVLLHELGHVFGAKHVAGHYVMNAYLYRSLPVYSPQTIAIMDSGAKCMQPINVTSFEYPNFLSTFNTIFVVCTVALCLAIISQIWCTE